MSSSKTLLFDFDGTLVDSMPTYGSVMLSILDEYGVSYDEGIIKIITPLGYIGTAEYYIKLGVKATVDELTAKMTEYMIDAYSNKIVEKKDVKNTLTELKKKGYDLNVLTASPHSTLDPCLKRNGLWELFSNVWSCNDFKTTKADPKIYGMCAEKIGVRAENIIFLDDNYNACETAKKRGLKVIGVYDDTSSEYTDEIKGLCDGYINCFSELPELLLNI
jgi:HAD superfamily hydrolase (TIGR01509 family)